MPVSRLVAGLLWIVLAGAGCSSPPTGLGAELPGTAWTLERIVYADGQVNRGAGERIAFNPDGSVMLTSCNTCNGSFRLRGNRLSIRGPLACTRRGCRDGEIELERYVEGARDLRRDGAYLIVEGGDGEAAETQLLFLPASDAAPAATP